MPTLFVLEVLGSFPWGGESEVTRSTFAAVLQMLVAFSALRAYALSRNMSLSILIFLLSMVPIAVNFVSVPSSVEYSASYRAGISQVCFRFGLGGYTVPIVSCVGYNKIPVDLSRKYGQYYLIS